MMMHTSQPQSIKIFTDIAMLDGTGKVSRQENVIQSKFSSKNRGTFQTQNVGEDYLDSRDFNPLADL
jgi:hypothetical protein